MGHPRCLPGADGHARSAASRRPSSKKNSFPSPDFPQCLTHGIPAHLCCTQTKKHHPADTDFSKHLHETQDFLLQSLCVGLCCTGTHKDLRPAYGDTPDPRCTGCCEHRGCSTPCTPCSNQSSVQVCTSPRVHSHVGAHKGALLPEISTPRRPQLPSSHAAASFPFRLLRFSWFNQNQQLLSPAATWRVPSRAGEACLNPQMCD